MRISDWSSDVCSSDLIGGRQRKGRQALRDRSHQIDAVLSEIEHNDRQNRESNSHDRPCLGRDIRRAWAKPQSDQRGLEALAHPEQEQGCRRSEEHTSEIQSLMRISYAVFCLKQHTNKTTDHNHIEN